MIRDSDPFFKMIEMINELYCDNKIIVELFYILYESGEKLVCCVIAYNITIIQFC